MMMFYQIYPSSSTSRGLGRLLLVRYSSRVVWRVKGYFQVRGCFALRSTMFCLISLKNYFILLFLLYLPNFTASRELNLTLSGVGDLLLHLYKDEATRRHVFKDQNWKEISQT